MITLSSEDKEAISKVFNFYEIRELDNTTELYGDPIVDVNVLYGQLYAHFSKQNESVALTRSMGESVLVIGRAKPDNIWINVALAVATLLTTTAVGAILYGVNIFEQPLQIYMGLPFALAIMLVLGSHELGHYIVSKKHGVDATLPYFIPFPMPPIGTMGAIIRQKGPVPDRKALFDVGISGPMVGLVVAVIVTAIGLMLPPVVVSSSLSDIVSWKVQTPLLFDAIAAVVHPGMSMDNLNPIAFAGWVGMLVTMLNMIPVGQLDGGHVAYAVLGTRQKTVARLVIAVLVVLGITAWSGWLVWAALLLLMGIEHPPVVYEWVPLDRKRTIVGWLALLLFATTFTPVPF